MVTTDEFDEAAKTVAAEPIGNPVPMKLWVLKKNRGGGYGETGLFVIRAATEAIARQMAHDNEGNGQTKVSQEWRDPVLTSCVELTANGAPEVIANEYSD